ncbi:MAG TPA: sulfite exporter TauE/SafE family protein [Candidatus Tectomicrobia bacterium]|nr:sulfite exporter TauE/SafE family protein [Candidatus Tectomicrobia bacterium]
MTWLAAAGAVLAAAFVKGAIGMGFPTLATPLLTLFMDVKTAVVVLILPNIVMDSVQFARRGAPMAVVRRMAVLILAGGVGTVLGTALLVVLSSRTVTLVLGVLVLLFVALSLMRVAPTVAPGWERWLSPVVGLAAGIVGGVTNVYGTALVLYFYALGMAKHEFVASLALTFLVTKVVQLGSVAWYGLLTWPLVGASLGLTAVALVAFRLGILVQDRLDQRAFNRAVLVFLSVLGAWLVGRGLGAG